MIFTGETIHELGYTLDENKLNQYTWSRKVPDKSINVPDCVNHPSVIFGTKITDELKQEWDDNGLIPYQYGCMCNDLLVVAWTDFNDPVVKFKSSNMYDMMRNIITINTISGTFYRGTDYDYTPLNIGDKIDYSDRLSSWSSDIKLARGFTLKAKPLILKLECVDAKGLTLYDRTEKESILDECVLIITNKEEYEDGTLLTVSIQ